MADQITPASTEAGLREELDASREEVLRLRDLLIAKDAEMGELKGEIAQLQSHLRLLHSLFAVVSRVPGLRRVFVAVVRRVLARLGSPGA